MRINKHSRDIVGGVHVGKDDVSYVCIGEKASHYLMPKEILSDKDSGGGRTCWLRQWTARCGATTTSPTK